MKAAFVSTLIVLLALVSVADGSTILGVTNRDDSTNGRLKNRPVRGSRGYRTQKRKPRQRKQMDHLEQGNNFDKKTFMQPALRNEE